MAKRLVHEPVFVLRGQDKLASVLVRLWASLAERGGCSTDKIRSAHEVADQMEKWPDRKMPD